MVHLLPTHDQSGCTYIKAFSIPLLINSRVPFIGSYDILLSTFAKHVVKFLIS